MNVYSPQIYSKIMYVVQLSTHLPMCCIIEIMSVHTTHWKTVQYVTFLATSPENPQ